MTISDIAKLAGVSVATVSRVINNKGYVKDETRRRIECLIKENGYRPNAVARSLTSSDTAMLAVIMSNKLNPFFANVLDAIEERAGEQGYSILFYNTSENREKECRAIAQAIEHRVMGILLLPVMDSDERAAELLKRAEESGIPVVLIDRKLKHCDFDIVLIDNKKVIYEGVKLLIGAGHRKIGIVTCPEIVKKGKTRLEGYIQCLNDNAIAVREDYIYPGNYDEKSGYQACEALLGLEEPPTAILSACSSATLGCIRYMNEHGLQTGRDIGLIGFDDISLLNALGYELTIMDRPIRELGEISYDLLMERMGRTDVRKSYREVLLQTRMIICGSEQFTREKNRKSGIEDGEKDTIQL